MSEIDEVWHLLSLHKFDVESGIPSEELVCIICQRLMIDACHGACGCRYCYQCISDYLKEGDRQCPGGKAVCTGENLLMDRDVSRTLRINNTIAKLRVVCPNNACHTKVELSGMTEHLRVCSKQISQCPYVALGCDNKADCKDVILRHLDQDVLTHVQLLIDSIRNLKNEVEDLKECVRGNKLEIVALTENSKEKDAQICKMMEQLLEQRKEINEQMSFEKNLVQEEAVKKNESEKMEDDKMMIEVMNNDLFSKESELKLQKEEFEKMRRESKMERENVAMLVNSIRKNVNDMKLERERYDSCRDRSILKWTRLCANIEMDFLWRIGVSVQKVGTEITSDPFYSSHYRLCLRLCVEHDYIGLYWHIVRGDRDNLAIWPMRRVVTVSIVDQDSQKSHKSHTYKYDTYKGNKTLFDRPRTDSNEGIGEQMFLKIARRQPSSVLVSDYVIVSCVTSDP